MSDTTCVQLHHRPITSASNYNRITLGYDHEQDFIRNIMLVHVLVWPAELELESSGGCAASDSWEIKWDGCKQFVRCEMQLRWASQSSAVWDAGRCVYIAADGCKLRCEDATTTRPWVTSSTVTTDISRLCINLWDAFSHVHSINLVHLVLQLQFKLLSAHY